MRRLIRRLDSEMERSGNSQVFYLKYSKAEDLVDVLKQVSGTLTAAKKRRKARLVAGVRLSPSPPANTVMP